MKIRVRAVAALVLWLAGAAPPVAAAPPSTGFVAKLTYTCPPGTPPSECVAVGEESASTRWFQLVLIPGVATPGARLDPRDLHGARETAAGLGLAVAFRTYRDPQGTLDPGGDRYGEKIREAAQQILFMEKSYIGDQGRSLVDFCTASVCTAPTLVRSDLAGAADEIRNYVQRIFEARPGQGLVPRGGRSAAPRVPAYDGLEGRTE